jgi:uncharacterized membrane protein SpoIIM required for sporulation
MNTARGQIQMVWQALRRAGIFILLVATINFGGVLVGSVMVHSGNNLALSYRDGLVARAHASDPASLAREEGNPWRAALIDFGRNLFLGAIPETIGGMTIVMPLFLSAYRSWVGGIVTVNGDHVSRFANPFQAAYVISVLILQLIPYSLAAGVGVNLGWSIVRPRVEYRGSKWYGISVQALRDAALVYVLIVPIFFIASLWEFLSPWN